MDGDREISETPENLLCLEETISESSSSEEDRNSIITVLSFKQEDDADYISHARNIYISDLSGYRSMITQQLAAISFHALVSQHFTFNEIMAFVNHPKVSVWSKFLGKIRPIIPSQIKSSINF